MRATIHLVSRRDYWPFAVGVREARRAWWLRAPGERDRRASSMPTRRERCGGALRGRAAAPRRDRGSCSASASARVGLCARPGPRAAVGHVGAPPRRPLRPRRGLDRAAESATRGRGESSSSPAATSAASGRRRAQEIADWAGLTVTALAPALERLELRRFRDEDGKELLDLPRAPLPGPGHAGARALPADLGRDAARPRAPDRDPPRGVPAPRLQHQDPPLGEHVPRRRPGRGTVALRAGPRSSSTVRPAHEATPRRAERRGRAASRLPRVGGARRSRAARGRA